MKFYQYDIRDLNDEKYIHYYSLMSEAKKHRVDRFRFQNDKKRTVSGEMLARQAISKWCNIEEESIIFEITEHGKPYVKNLNVEFNISHSADMVVCIVDDTPVGVDIEKIRHTDLNAAKWLFNEDEIRYIFECMPKTEEDYNYYLSETVLHRFFSHWTKKEAYGKLAGTGLGANLNVLADLTTWIEKGYCISIAVLVNQKI